MCQKFEVKLSLYIFAENFCTPESRLLFACKKEWRDEWKEGEWARRGERGGSPSQPGAREPLRRHLPLPGQQPGEVEHQAGDSHSCYAGGE